MNAYWKIVSKAGFFVAGVLILSACGGGGTTITPTTVSGIASKGLVTRAKVLVCRIVNGTPEADASCGATTSGSDGSFMVTLSDGFTGPALVKVMAATGSMMLDETTGGDIPYAMTMRAVVPSVAATTTVYVTPFSEMVANAVGTSTMDADKIRQAMATVQSMMSGLGVDLAVKPMLDLQGNGSDPIMLGKQANMMQQLTRIRMAAMNPGLPTDANGVACNVPTKSSSEQIACVVKLMADLMTGVNAYDHQKAGAVLAALSAQSVTAAYIPMVKTDGTLAMPTQSVDMTSVGSMQGAMQNAGLSSSTAVGTVTTMMSRMH